MRGSRGQTFTLEGVLSALVVLAGMAFALQAVVVAPTDSGAAAGSTDGDRLERVLEQSVGNGSVKRAVLAWDGSAFDEASSGNSYFVEDLPENAFGNALEDGSDPSVSVNVLVNHAGSSSPQRLAYNGVPENSAVRESVTVALYDQDSIYTENGDRASGTLGSRGSGFYYIDDQNPGLDLYAVVEVEVVMW